MLNYNPKLVTALTDDQAVLNVVVAISKQATLFYQRAVPEMTNQNIRRHFVELVKLHQQANRLNGDNHPAQTNNPDITAICQWYRQYSAKISDEHSWLTELPEQLCRQLTAFKQLSRKVSQPENAMALANLTASLQIRIDELHPLLLNKQI